MSKVYLVVDLYTGEVDSAWSAFEKADAMAKIITHGALREVEIDVPSTVVVESRPANERSVS